MKIDVFAANGPTPEALAEEFNQWCETHVGAPDFVALHQSVPSLDAGLLSKLESVRAVHGATSCLGVMSNSGPHVEAGAGAFAIWDPDGDYGTAVVPFDGDPRMAARRAVEDALMHADRPGEAPDLIWLSASPGQEELVLAGLEDIVGHNVPILGGSAADNTIEGAWRIFDGATDTSEGVVVSVLFPSRPVSFAYHNGYAPTQHHGTVTETDGRFLKTIDGRPAAAVYDAWTGGQVIPEDMSEPVGILSASTLFPLGRHLDDVGGVPYYLLAHPSGATPDGALELFADLEVGEQLTLMTGASEQLTQRAGKVASLAVQAGDMAPSDVAGALMVYCGGCMLAVKDDLANVVDGVKEALPNTPFLGIFTFGEQGVVLNGDNRHGNLMISAIVFAT